MTLNETFALKGVKVMVVDDDLDSRDLVSVLLELHGAEVLTFADASAALAVFSEWQPQMVISDIAMPLEDGYSFIQRIRSLEKEQGGGLPAIAISGMAKEEDKQQALQAGFNEYFTKPVDLEKLLDTIVLLLGIR